jgi:2-polyprenyl-3-methyl-5-hydroxy-6-metoxy-1,4-benzoquinol methylase
VNLGNADFNQLSASLKKEYQVAWDQLDLNDPDYALAVLLKNIAKETVVLDVGCSYGYLGEWLAQHRQCRVYGVDFNSRAVSALRERKQYQDVFLLDLDELGKPGEEYKRFEAVAETFDYVVFADVLEHLKNPAEALLKLTGKLNDRGEVLVSVPNIAHADIILNLIAGRFNYSEFGILDNTHLRFFTRASFLQWIDLLNVQATDGFYFEGKEIGRTHYRSDFSGAVAEKYPAFYALVCDETDAEVLQFVFSLRKHRAQSRPQETGRIAAEGKNAPDLVWTAEKKDAFARLAGKAAELSNQTQGRDEVLENQAHLIDELQKKLARISGSRGWKMLEHYYRFRDSLFSLKPRQGGKG